MYVYVIIDHLEGTTPYYVSSLKKSIKYVTKRGFLHFKQEHSYKNYYEYWDGCHYIMSIHREIVN